MSKENLEKIVEKDDEKFDSSYLKYWIPLYGMFADLEDHLIAGMSCHEKGLNARFAFQAASWIGAEYFIYKLSEYLI